MGSFRNTKQSLLILDIINNSYNHLTAYDVYEVCKKEISNISLGTVYRNLHNLVDNHKIRCIIGLDGVEHYDNLKNDHNHFICVKCQKIDDIYDKIKVPIKSNLGKVINYEILYKGICNNCMEKEN